MRDPDRGDAILSPVTSRFVRVLLVLLALAATLGLTYHVVQDEVAAARADDRYHDIERMADAVLAKEADLRAALYAYVAAGQGSDFWIGHAGTLLESFDAGMRELADAATASHLAIEAPEKDAMAALEAAEARARRYVQNQQQRLAADLLFNDARNALDALRLQAARIREMAAATSRASHLVQQRQRALFAGGALLVWLVVALVLVPVPPQTPAAVAAPPEAERATPPVMPARPAMNARTATTAGKATAGRAAAPAAAAIRPSTASAPSAPTAIPAKTNIAPPTVTTAPDLPAAATVCGELARATTAAEIERQLERVAGIVNASGLIVWLADAEALHPAAAWGYDDRVLSRVASIPRDGTNLTVTAFRAGTLRISPARDGAAAAVAAPIVGPAGVAGVLSAELRDVVEATPAASAILAIVAAQLAALVGAMPAADPPAREANAQA